MSCKLAPSRPTTLWRKPVVLDYESTPADDEDHLGETADSGSYLLPVQGKGFLQDILGLTSVLEKMTIRPNLRSYRCGGGPRRISFGQKEIDEHILAVIWTLEAGG